MARVKKGMKAQNENLQKLAIRTGLDALFSMT
jgi:hypothetical protein